MRRGATLTPLPAPAEDEWANAAEATEPITRSSATIMRKERYGDMVKGEKVVLDGEAYPRFKQARFEFLCHARNEETGKDWIELWGGRRGYESVVAVNPQAVLRITR